MPLARSAVWRIADPRRALGRRMTAWTLALGSGLASLVSGICLAAQPHLQSGSPQFPGSSAPPPVVDRSASAASPPEMAAHRTLAALQRCLARPPRYPQEAMRNGWQGRSVLRFKVDADGSVTPPTVAQSSGHAVLDEAALAFLNSCLRSAPVRNAGPLPAGSLGLPVTWILEEVNR